MSTAYDEEREDRLYASLDLGWDQGDLYDPADHTEPEPLPVRVSLAKRPVLCRRPKLGSKGKTCFGEIRGGVCRSCFRAPRKGIR